MQKAHSVIAETCLLEYTDFLYMVDALQAARCANEDVSCFNAVSHCTAVLELTPGGGAGCEAAGGSAAAAQRCSLHLQGAHAGPPRMTRSPPHPAPRQSTCTAEYHHHLEQASQISHAGPPGRALPWPHAAQHLSIATAQRDYLKAGS